VFLAAVRLRSGSLWTGIVLHGLWDAGTFLVAAGGAAAGATAAAPTALGDYGVVILSVPLFLLGLFFLRHAGRDYGKDYA
jgi:membrane protease YdiL (CAAX protease family)